MVKTILVGIDGSEHSRAALGYSLWLAERTQATLCGLHVIDIVTVEGSFLHDISGSLGFEPYLDFSSKMREALYERGRALLSEFTHTCRTRNVASDTRLEMGVVANQIAEESRMADLVAIGQRGVNERFSTGLLGGTTESVTRKCPKPVLVSPIEFRPASKALLAYDGSERASAAMHIAAELCATLDLPLHVITIARDVVAGEKTLSEAQRYVGAYEISASYAVLPGHPPEGIVACLAEGGYDLLFIGSHGHRRIVEMVIGSTTEYVLRNSGCPVLLSR